MFMWGVCDQGSVPGRTSFFSLILVHPQFSGNHKKISAHIVQIKWQPPTKYSFFP